MRETKYHTLEERRQAQILRSALYYKKIKDKRGKCLNDKSHKWNGLQCKKCGINKF